MRIVKRSVAHGLSLDNAHGRTHLEGMETKLYTTVAVDPANGYQATSKETGYWAQYAVTGPHAWAVRCTYSHSDAVTFQHGPWDEDGARRFARSMGCGDHAQAVQVAPYYYCEAWGRVPAASVGPLDAERMGSWRTPLRPGQVLASDKSQPLGGGVNIEAAA